MSSVMQYKYLLLYIVFHDIVFNQGRIKKKFTKILNIQIELSDITESRRPGTGSCYGCYQGVPHIHYLKLHRLSFFFYIFCFYKIINNL